MNSIYALRAYKKFFYLVGQNLDLIIYNFDYLQTSNSRNIIYKYQIQEILSSIRIYFAIVYKNNHNVQMWDITSAP